MARLREVFIIQHRGRTITTGILAAMRSCGVVLAAVMHRSTETLKATPNLIPKQTLSQQACSTQCGGKNLGPVIRIPCPPIQLKDPINVSPVIRSIASAEDVFRRGTPKPQ